MGRQDAGQSLKEIIIRKEGERRTGAIFGGALARPSETASSRKRFRMEELCLLCSMRDAVTSDSEKAARWRAERLTM